MAHVVLEHGEERMRRDALVQLGIGALGAALDLNTNGVRTLAGAATLGITMPFSRDNEAEADAVGLRFMARAGYDPREAIAVWRNFERAGRGGSPEFLSAHPAPGNRAARLEAMLPDVMPIYHAAIGEP